MKSEVNKSPKMEQEPKPRHSKTKKKMPLMRKTKTQLFEEELTEIQSKLSQIKDLNTDEINSFAKLPICKKTLKGLKENEYTVPTKVQRETLIHSLNGSDVVGAAKTGSGKTLAFLIPLLEELHRNKWSPTDGIGAIVITPTRELAYQIHELVIKIGKHHNFSIALAIGGKDWKYEQNSVGHRNILICTPGRLLHHMTTSTNFDCSNMLALVLDEADMCLSLGFAKDMNAILEELPKERKTWLFSATQTRDVKNLIRAGCKNPIFCSVHEHSKSSTPKSLTETYIVCEVEDKINFLFSYLKHHKKQKILVFFSTCKQVRYVNSVFRQLRPGLTVLNIHGEMHQLRRMAVYDEFCRKQNAVLFATDVAARGLDIPSVDWVVQYDCPEDVNTYIHRAGRTARYSSSGEALLMLTPSEEEAMIQKIQSNNINIEKIEVDSRKMQTIQRSLACILVKHNHIFPEAQRAFKSYIKSIALMKDKSVFNVNKINYDAFAKSLGLEVTPRLRFLDKRMKKDKQKFTAEKVDDNDDDEDDDFLVSNKSRLQDYVPDLENIPGQDTIQPLPIKKSNKKPVTKEMAAQKLLKKNLQINTRVVFDDKEETEVIDELKQNSIQVNNNIENLTERNNTINIDDLRKEMKQQDQIDKKIHAEKRKTEKREEKAKIKEAKIKNNKEADETYDEEDSELDLDTQDIIDSLPDPDKIYGKERGSDEDMSNDDSVYSASENVTSDSDSDESEFEEQSEVKNSGKRLAKQKAKNAKRAKLIESNNIESLGMSEQEQLALYLLNKS